MSLSLPVGLPPPTKKARTESDSALCSDEGIPPSFYLDIIPKEVLENVLRYFSRLPAAKDWVPHILLETIIELYGVNGELGTLMETRFTTLCISYSFKNASDTLLYRWEQRTGEMLFTEDMDVARRFVLGGGGQNLRTIIVGKNRYVEDCEYEIESESESNYGEDCAGDCDAVQYSEPNIVDDFLESCPNVVSLSIIDKKGEWTSKFGDQLKSLEIVTKKSSKILDSCRNLRKLNLYAPHGEDLQCIGDTLECLTLYCTGDETSGAYARYESAMEAIEKYCRNLRSITFYNAKDCAFGNLGNMNADISRLLASYGDQLDYCFVEFMSEGGLANIASACKNVRFSVKIHTPAQLCPTLKVLGPELDKLDADFIWGWEGNPDYVDLKNAWNGCVNIRDLRVKYCTIEHAKAIMAIPKVRLTKLCISPASDVRRRR